MNISLTSESQRVVEERIRAGDYQNAAQVVEDALQLLESFRRAEEHPANIERLRALVKVGIDQADRGECRPIDFDEFRAQLLAEYAERQKTRGKGNGSSC